MHEDLMADSDSLSLKHTRSVVSGLPDFCIGFGNKGSPDSDSVNSPTSPLDLGPFPNHSNLLQLKLARSVSENGKYKKWDCRKPGLGIVASLVDETKATSEVHVSSSYRETIIFRPHVKQHNRHSSKLCFGSEDYAMKSLSLPRNYIIRPLSETMSFHPKMDGVKVTSGIEGLHLDCEPSENIVPCLSDSSQASPQIVAMQGESSLGFKKSSLGFKKSSLPVPIVSIPDREIELSEDYTCIISHGPNPKTTHIFCDCILECHTKDLNNVDKETAEVESSQMGEHQDGAAQEPSDELSRACYTCKKNLEGDESHMSRSEIASRGLDCRLDNNFAVEEAEGTWDKSARSSPKSNNDDLLLLGMHSEEILDIGQ